MKKWSKNCLHLLTDQSRGQVFSRIRTYNDGKVVMKAISSYLRDFQYPSVFVTCFRIVGVMFHLGLGKALYNIVLNQMSPRHISGILYEYPQFTMWLPLILVKAYFTVYSWNRKCVWASFWQIWTEKRVFCWSVMTFSSMALLTKCLAGS